MRHIIFATQNEGKVKEIKEILKGLPVEIMTMGEAGIELDIEETGTTFEENAIIKAEALKEYTEGFVLADDSGLEIDCLNKEPGVYSARYLGKDTPYTEKNEIILQRLQEIPLEERRARFVCVIAIAGKNIQTKTIRATIEGYIGYEAKGDNGFGYDPIFYVEGLDQSTAELSAEMKNKISHRGKALTQMKTYIEQLLGEANEDTCNK